jgi:aspartyl protease family protein
MDAMNMVELMGVLALVSSGLLYARAAPLKPAVRIAALWLAVAVVLLLGFAFRGPLLSLGQTLRSALIPGYPVQTAAGEMMITESTDGAYLVIGRVNGTPVHFMVDTGASDIVLSPADARRLGIALDTLVFAHVYETANGQGRGAPYRVATLQVGGIVLHDVPVSINQAPMQTSLLGMTFLRRLKSFAIADHKMVLRW